MFHQVVIKEADQRGQMILWDSGRPGTGPATYVVTLMTFGAACFPSSAKYVKNLNTDRFADEFPRAAECIKHEHCVDDMLASVETQEEAKELAGAVRYIHDSGGFWNQELDSREVVRHLERDLEEEGNVKMSCKLPNEKVLGMWWNISADMFTFRLTSKHDEELLSGRKGDQTWNVDNANEHLRSVGIAR